MTLADRLRTAMAHAEISQAELARACGVKPPSVNGWLSGKAKFLRGENLLQVARVLSVDQDWLATGRGQMSPKERVPTRIPDHLALRAETPQELRILAAYRMANAKGRGIIDDAVDVAQEMFSDGRAANQA